MLNLTVVTGSIVTSLTGLTNRRMPYGLRTTAVPSFCAAYPIFSRFIQDLSIATYHIAQSGAVT